MRIPNEDPLAVVGTRRGHDLGRVTVPANCCPAERKITMSDSLWSTVDEEAGRRMIKTNGVDLCTQAFGDPANPGLLLIMREQHRRQPDSGLSTNRCSTLSV